MKKKGIDDRDVKNVICYIANSAEEDLYNAKSPAICEEVILRISTGRVRGQYSFIKGCLFEIMSQMLNDMKPSQKKVNESLKVEDKKIDDLMTSLNEVVGEAQERQKKHFVYLQRIEEDEVESHYKYIDTKILDIALEQGYMFVPDITRLEVFNKNGIYHVNEIFDKNKYFTICLDKKIELETAETLNLKKDELFICYDGALSENIKNLLSMLCNLKTIEMPSYFKE